MSTRTLDVSPLAALSTSPRPPASPTPTGPTATARRAAAWVVAMVWGLPLLGFTAAVVLALAASGCALASGGVLILVANLVGRAATPPVAPAAASSRRAPPAPRA